MQTQVNVDSELFQIIWSVTLQVLHLSCTLKNSIAHTFTWEFSLQIGKGDQILRALFNEKVATSVSHQNFVTFWKKSVWT